MVDNQGLPLSSTNGQAVDELNRAVTRLLEYRITAMPAVKRAIELDPDFCMAHCLRGYMLMMFSTVTVYDSARGALDNAQRLSESATSREREHVRALEFWLAGDLQSACAHWEWILTDHPRDILALRLHNFVSFWMGRAQPLISVPAAVLPRWDRDVPNYGNVLGMLAFGLEENGQYEAAERFGREAVALNPHDLWAVHSVAHVLETQRRHTEGIEWINFSVDYWEDRNPFRGHLWWHRGLFLIEGKRLDEALTLYDTVIYDTKSDFYLDIQNAASFLARLEFNGVGVGNRWEVLAAHALAHKDDHALVFTDIHCVMSLARTRRFDQSREFIASMRECSLRDDFHVAQVLRRVGIQICESIVAFYEGKYDRSVQGLMKLKPLVFEVGASIAQRDLISLYAIEAARSSGKSAVLQHLASEHDFLEQLAERR